MGTDPFALALAAEWLAKQDPVLVGSDNWPVEVAPNPDKATVAPAAIR